MTTSKQLYCYARQHGLKAHAALHAARAYIAGPLTKYQADLAAWNAEPDKRRYAPGGSANRPTYPRFYESRDTDAHGPTFSPDSRYAGIPTCTLDGFRSVGNVDEITFDHPGEREIYRALVDHKGWFADAFEDETYRGHVWQLPARNGARLYLAGYSEAASGYSILCASNGALETFDELRDAINAADSLAERNAEREREYQERWQEASQCADDIETARADAAIARKNWRTLRNAARVPGMTSNESADLVILAEDKRATHAELIALIIAKRERIAELDMKGEF